jgi:hypothetical protein
MFERFTADARAVVAQAVGEAERPGDSDRHIGTEHLLLALSARTAPGPAHQPLTAMSTDPADLHADLERRIGNTT